MADITRMTLQDLDTVIELGLTVPELQDSDEPEFFSRKTLSAWIEHPDDVLLVARESGRVLGFLIASFHAVARIGYIYDLAIAPDMRGRGLGKALLEHCLTLFEARRPSQIWCLVHEDSHEVSRLYERYGLLRGRKFHLHIKLGED